MTKKSTKTTSKKSNEERELYASPAQFVHQYSLALLGFLEDVNGQEKSHIEDLAFSTEVFSKAFAHTISRFS